MPQELSIVLQTLLRLSRSTAARRTMLAAILPFVGVVAAFQADLGRVVRLASAEHLERPLVREHALRGREQHSEVRGDGVAMARAIAMQNRNKGNA